MIELFCKSMAASNFWNDRKSTFIGFPDSMQLYIYRMKAEKCQARKGETFFTPPVSWFQDHTYICIYKKQCETQKQTRS